MATANPANAIEFGKFNYGASLVSFTVTAAADISAQNNPGEEMGQIIECMSQHGTFMGLSAIDAAGKVFTVTMENSSWANAAAVQTALQALSLPVAGAMTVA